MTIEFKTATKVRWLFKGAQVVCCLAATGCAQTGFLGSQEGAPIESRNAHEQQESRVPEASTPAPMPVQQGNDDSVVNISPLEDEGVGLAVPIDEQNVSYPDKTTSNRAPNAATSATNPATEQILGDAQAALIKGDLHMAESVTNRGLRIAPTDPALWLQLAKIRLGQGEYLEAISLSERAQVLAINNPAAQIDALEIIASAHDSLGDNAKAAATRGKILKLSGEMGSH